MPGVRAPCARERQNIAAQLQSGRTRGRNPRALSSAEKAALQSRLAVLQTAVVRHTTSEADRVIDAQARRAASEADRVIAAVRREVAELRGRTEAEMGQDRTTAEMGQPRAAPVEPRGRRVATPKRQQLQHTEADIVAGRQRRPWRLFELIGSTSFSTVELSEDTWMAAVVEQRKCIFCRVWPGQRPDTLQPERLRLKLTTQRGVPRVGDAYIVRVRMGDQELIKAGVSIQAWQRARKQDSAASVVAVWQRCFVAPSLTADVYSYVTDPGSSSDTTPEVEWRKLMGPSTGDTGSKETWTLDRLDELLRNIGWVLSTSRMSTMRGKSPQEIIEQGKAAAQQFHEGELQHRAHPNTKKSITKKSNTKQSITKKRPASALLSEEDKQPNRGFMEQLSRPEMEPQASALADRLFSPPDSQPPSPPAAQPPSPAARRQRIRGKGARQVGLARQMLEVEEDKEDKEELTPEWLRRVAWPTGLPKQEEEQGEGEVEPPMSLAY